MFLLSGLGTDSHYWSVAKKNKRPETATQNYRGLGLNPHRGGPCELYITTSVMYAYCILLGLGTDEDAIIGVWPKRTNAQRQELKTMYKTMYSKVSTCIMPVTLFLIWSQIYAKMIMCIYVCHKLL